MGNLGVMIVAGVVVLGLFVLGMSLTLIFKGHHIKSEISENEHMRSRGLKCAVQEIREEEKALRGGEDCGINIGCASADCSTCEPEKSNEENGR